MIDLSGRLQALGFTPLADYELQDDGDGPYIREWMSALPQPSRSELETAVVPPERRRVDKWVIAERIEAAGKSDAAYELLTMPGNRAAFIKWNMPIESVFYDDPDTLLFINALGLDPAVIMAP